MTDTYHGHEKARTKTFVDKMTQQLAVELGDEWSHIKGGPDKDLHYLRRADGLEIFVSLNWTNPTRLVLSQASRPAAWVDSENQRVELLRLLPKITVASKRNPAQVAKEITRRLLPEAEELHTIAMKRVEERNTAHKKRQTAARELKIDGDSREWRIKMNSIPFCYVEAKISGPYGTDDSATVCMELSSLTVDQAKAVLTALGLEI